MKIRALFLLILIIPILSSCEENFAYNAGHLVGKNFLYIVGVVLICYIIFRLFKNKKK